MELRRRAKKAIDELSGSQLRMMKDILDYVRDRPSKAATRDLLEIPGFMRSFRRGTQDIRAGRVTDWRKVRRDV
jgi:hypothetical protein